MRTLIFICSLIIITGCISQPPKDLNETNTISALKYSLIPIDTVKIPIDTLTSNFNRFTQYKELNGQKLFAIYNSKAHKIQAYNIESRESYLNINLNKEGPEEIPHLLGFHIHSFDSIFLFSFNENKILLIDSGGVMIDSYYLNETLEKENNQFEMDMEFFFEVSYLSKNHLLTIWVAPLISRATIEYFQYPLAVDYNIKTKKVEHNYGLYPENYRDNGIYYLLNSLGRINTTAYDIHYFNCSHFLYLYDNTTKELVRKVYAKSQYLPDEIEPIMYPDDEKPILQEQANYHTTLGRYNKLHFDNENNLFYRFVNLPQELRASDGLLNGKIDNKFSVMILNADFGISGEVELPAKTFWDRTSFVSEGLLWININHPKNPLNDENYYQFIVYQPALL
ncbi:MAG: DUF4221 domain-containing protein [Cyclobacteriaceae bacterium]|nr:DUF4221 domain-containing protein [Cyclobacteriaceae bacterium]